jgi:hypothetical protein
VHKSCPRGRNDAHGRRAAVLKTKDMHLVTVYGVCSILFIAPYHLY